MAGAGTRGPIGVDSGAGGIPTDGPAPARPGALGLGIEQELHGVGAHYLMFFPDAIQSALGPIIDRELTEFGRFYEPFKSAVLAAQVAAETKPKAPSLTAGELDVVEHSHQLVKDAATQCRLLLAAAREDVESGPRGGATSIRIGITSAYRSLEKERLLWNSYFLKYYFQTQSKRNALPGGPYGAAAIKYMAGYVKKRKAAPGYSNHSRGTALDFFTTIGRHRISANVSQISEWRNTPLWKWLSNHAGDFQFEPYDFEPWHWEFNP
jgi:hypothetical protein